MKTNRNYAFYILFVGFGLMALTFQNCAPGGSGQTPFSLGSSAPGSSGSTSLATFQIISPASSTSMAANGTIAFSVTGGIAPYSYTVTSGKGTFKVNAFTAPATAETDQITVKDSSNPALTANATIMVTITPPPPDMTEVPVYRFYYPKTGEHFFSLSATEGTNAGFSAEGSPFKFYSSSTVPNSIPVYRCLGSKHFISAASNCEGAANEGLLGYIYSSTQANSTALYRFYNSTFNDFLETTDMNEGINAGYSLQLTLGYVPTK